eukprot:gene9255-1342_t
MILILNFGGQFCHLIARRIRELQVLCEIVPYNVSVSEIRKLNPVGIIISGGPSSVYEQDSPLPDSDLFNLDIPILGICYGQQLIAKFTGGKVEKSSKKEYGLKIINVQKNSLLLDGLESTEKVWMSHSDHVVELSSEFDIIASSDTCKYAAIENQKKKIFGIQFHGEVHHTTCGKIIFENFVFKICKATKDWKIENVTDRIIKELKEKIGEDSVIMGVSGGVDSTVAATLLHHAIGKNLHCVFIDNGLLRKDEREEVCQMFQNDLSMENFLCIDAKEEFLTGLKGITDPEEKRKIIGHTFIKIFENAIEKIIKETKTEHIKFLGQGTIYPDRIESAEPTKQASKIKSHHNLTLPDDMKLKVIEPLREFYKDEVRKVGEILKVPKKLIMRHPCPGPALAIRILGDVTESRLKIVRESDKIFIDTLWEMNHYDKVWQAFAVLLPLKTVGVQGDARTYEFIISLRAVNSVDGMTADFCELPYELLRTVSSRIINNVDGVNRVVYDVSQKPPATIEYE